MTGKESWIRKRIQRKHEIEQEVAEDELRERRYQERIRAQPEQRVWRFDRGRDPDAQDSTALDRSIQWRQRAYAETVLGEQLDELPPTTPKAKRRSPVTAKTGMLRDRRENFLYWEWQLSQAAEDPEALDWEPWNEVVAVRGVLRLLAYYPRGEELLRDLYKPHEYGTMPTKKDAQAFLDSHPLWLFEDSMRGAEEFLAEAYIHVPGIKRAAFRVLASYKRIVRDTWQAEGRPDEPGLLLGDDDPQEPVPVTWDLLVRAYGQMNDMVTVDHERLAEERAVMMVSQGVPARDAAKANGIGINRFYEILRERGLSRRRGRPKGES